MAAAGQAMKENVIAAKGSKDWAVAGKGLTFIETNIVPSDNVTGQSTNKSFQRSYRDKSESFGWQSNSLVRPDK